MSIHISNYVSGCVRRGVESPSPQNVSVQGDMYAPDPATLLRMHHVVEELKSLPPRRRGLVSSSCEAAAPRVLLEAGVGRGGLGAELRPGLAELEAVLLDIERRESSEAARGALRVVLAVAGTLARERGHKNTAAPDTTRDKKNGTPVRDFVNTIIRFLSRKK